jgi:hypothetical protein
MAIGRDTRLVRDDGVHQAELGPGQIALLGVAQGEYYGVDGPAALIWELLASEISVGAICDEVMKAYDVSEEQCLPDTIAFISELLSEKLVRVCD